MPDDQVYKTPQPDSGGDRESGCNCFYEILDAQFPPGPPEYPYRNLEFQTIDNCGLSNPCNVFKAFYYDGPDCNVGGLPECIDLWSSLPPVGQFAFNCLVPEYSSISGLFGTNYYLVGSGGCGAYPSDLSMITVRIACAEDCGNGSINYVYSDPATLISTQSNQEYFSVSLKGCGCEPKIILNQ
jgi:hypothetical protein